MQAVVGEALCVCLAGHIEDQVPNLCGARLLVHQATDEASPAGK
jgi:hypothetical protein